MLIPHKPSVWVCFFSLKCPAGEDFLLVKALQVVSDTQYEIKEFFQGHFKIYTRLMSFENREQFVFNFFFFCFGIGMFAFPYSEVHLIHAHKQLFQVAQNL